MNRILFAALLFALLSFPSFSQELPRTISREAKEFLQTAFDDAEEAPHTIEGWKELQKKIEEQCTLKSKAVVEKTGVHIELTKFDCIPVHACLPKGLNCQRESLP